MAWRVVVDFDLCESNAVCMGIAPEVFEVRDDDFLYVLDEKPAEALRPKIEEAVPRCPKQAISIARTERHVRSIVGASEPAWPGARRRRRCARQGFDGERRPSSAPSRTSPTTGRRCRSRCLAGSA